MKELFFVEKGIYYRINDFKPDRATLVLIHGASGSSSAWWPYEKMFENKYNMLTYDIRGHGMSKKYPNYGFEKHKGYGTKYHQTKLVSLGPCEIHRRSFAPVAKVL